MKRRATSPSSSAGYRPGENWVVCDHCGQRFRASQMRRQPHGLWKGLWVCPNDFDSYNPQHEDLRAVPEKIVPDKVNVEPEPTVLSYAGPLVFDFDFTPDPLFATDGSTKITGDDL